MLKSRRRSITVKKQLDKVYNEIYSEAFDCIQTKCCPCFEECKNSLAKKKNFKEKIYELLKSEYSFFGNHSIHLGENYHQCHELGIPKVVFIGKEDTSPSQATVDTADFVTQQNQHYRETRAILAVLLKQTDDVNYKDEKTYNFINGNEKMPLHTLFSLTNHYHCAYKESKKVHGLPSTDTMWENCCNVVKKELEMLKPDIFIIQAGWSLKNNAVEHIQKYFDEEKYSVEKDLNISALYWLKDKNDNSVKCCIIGTFHPSYPGSYNADYRVLLKERILCASNWFYSK